MFSENPSCVPVVGRQLEHRIEGLDRTATTVEGGGGIVAPDMSERRWFGSMHHFLYTDCQLLILDPVLAGQLGFPTRFNTILCHNNESKALH